jgi:hypothetical protein
MKRCVKITLNRASWKIENTQNLRNFFSVSVLLYWLRNSCSCVCVITVIGVNSVELLCCVNRSLCGTQQRTENSKDIESNVRAVQRSWKIFP